MLEKHRTFDVCLLLFFLRGDIEKLFFFLFGWGVIDEVSRAITSCVRRSATAK